MNNSITIIFRYYLQSSSSIETFAVWGSLCDKPGGNPTVVIVRLNNSSTSYTLSLIIETSKSTSVLPSLIKTLYGPES